VRGQDLTIGDADAELASVSGAAVPDAATSPPDEGDEALVDACVRGHDRAAFARLVSRHQASVFRLALSVLGPGAEAEAEDVTQKVFIRVAGGLAGFRGESAFRTWLRRLTVNLALDHRRLARWRKPHLDASVLERLPADNRSNDPHSRAVAAERAQTVHRCLDMLPTVVRVVIHLHYWMDCPVDEIAAMLGIPAGTVKSHMHRGRKLLHRAMQARGRAYE